MRKLTLSDAMLPLIRWLDADMRGLQAKTICIRLSNDNRIKFPCPQVDLSIVDRDEESSLLTALQGLVDWIDFNIPRVTPLALAVRFTNGARFETPWPGRGVIHFQGEWKPTRYQERILQALDGKAMRTDALGAAVNDRGGLFKKRGIKELRERGLVHHSLELGYYRPDAPPVELITSSQLIN